MDMEPEKENEAVEREKARKPLARRILKWVAWTFLAFFVLVAAFILLLPVIIPHIPIPRREYDLSANLTGTAAELVSNKTVTADVKIDRVQTGGFMVKAKGRILDWPYTASMRLHLGWICADGSFAVSLDDTDWKVTGSFGWESSTDWHLDASLGERSISQQDPVIADILSRLQSPALSNLVFSGTVSLDVSSQMSEQRPVPSWKARGALGNVDLSFGTDSGQGVDVKNLRVRFGADGISSHTDIAPMFPRADSIEAAGITLTNVYASLRATERAYLVTEAGAGCCGGEIKLYSLFLDPERLSAGAAIFADGIDAGQVLSRISGFSGDASGTLHGKLNFFLRNGSDLRINSAYLFSKPGETGKMRITEATPVMDNLARSGVSKGDRENLAKALSNLDYSVLKIEFRRNEDGDGVFMPIMIQGTSTFGETTVPVTLNVNLAGDFDKLINTGIKLSRRVQ